MRWMGWLRRKPRADAALIPTDGSPTALMHGRERVIGVPYALPVDLEEINRLDFQHNLLRHAFQGNYAAPIANPHSILDVGTGTGRWAIEMAQTFPQANVIGLDVKPPAVDDRAQNNQGPDPRPANYAFAPGNVLEGLPFADGTFDFVHQRLLFSAIPLDRWPWLVAEPISTAHQSGVLFHSSSPTGSAPASPRSLRLTTDICQICQIRYTTAPWQMWQMWQM